MVADIHAVFLCHLLTSAAEWEVPHEVYNIIETMLPTGKWKGFSLLCLPDCKGWMLVWLGSCALLWAPGSKTSGCTWAQG